MRLRRAFLAVAVIVGASACVGADPMFEPGGGTPPTEDAGGAVDASGSPQDSGGTPPPDAGADAPAGAASVTVDPVQHDFGAVDVGAVGRQSFSVTNASAVNVSSLAASVEGAFRISNDGCKDTLLAPNARCIVEVEFAPPAYGDATGLLQLKVDGRDTAKATLRGVGRDSVQLTAARDGAGSGTVTGAGIDCGTTCSAAVTRTFVTPVVTLNAVPAADSYFAGWSGGGCTGTAPSCAVSVADAVTVTATFEPKLALEFSLVQGPGATTSAASAPAGLSCAGACTTVGLFEPGADVTIQVTSSDAYRFFGDCTGTSCTLTMTKPMTVELRTTGYNYAFVSSAKYTGDLGGLDGADAKCAALATAAKLPGTFRAWLSTDVVNARDRFVAGGGFIRPDGKILATTKASLVATAWVRNPFWLDETGTKRASVTTERVWSGSFADGSLYVPVETCDGWTDARADDGAGTPIRGTVGATEYTVNWTQVNASTCSTPTRLHCMADDLSRAVPLPAVSGQRRAFISSGTVEADLGVGAMDALCVAEATSASLPNAGSFKALIAPADGQSAKSRLANPGGPPWVRIDGVPLASTASELLEGIFDAALELTADGVVPFRPFVFTGYRSVPYPTPAKLSASAGHTCAGWTSKSATDLAGVGYTTTTGFFNVSALAATDARGCDVPARIYCVED